MLDLELTSSFQFQPPEDVEGDSVLFHLVTGLMNSHGFAMIMALCVFAPFAACCKVVFHCGWFGDLVTSFLWLATLICFILGLAFWFQLKSDYGHGDISMALPKLSPDKGMHRILSVPIFALMVFGIFLFATRMLAVVLTSGEHGQGTQAMKVTKLVLWVNNLFGDDLMSHHVRRFIPICSFLALCSGLLTYHQIIFTAEEECSEVPIAGTNSTEKYCLSRFYEKWNKTQEPFYWHAIFIGIIILFVVQSCIGFYEHWLYFHGPDHIYHEKYHENFVKIAESILEEEEEALSDNSSTGTTKSLPRHKYKLKQLKMKKPNVKKMKKKLLGQQAPEPEQQKPKISLYPGQHSRV